MTSSIAYRYCLPGRWATAASKGSGAARPFFRLYPRQSPSGVQVGTEFPKSQHRTHRRRWRSNGIDRSENAPLHPLSKHPAGRPYRGLQYLNFWTPPSTPKPNVARIFEDLPLADPNFTTPGVVDLVIGANGYPSVLLPELIRREDFLAQRTVFGSVITG